MKIKVKSTISLEKFTMTICVPDAPRGYKNIRGMCVTHIVNITEYRIKLNITTAFQCNFTNFRLKSNNTNLRLILMKADVKD
jgi:hypothetical protein